jgi:hypothetical protein
MAVLKVGATDVRRVASLEPWMVYQLAVETAAMSAVSWVA